MREPVRGPLTIRSLHAGDARQWALLRGALWPGDEEEQAREVARYLTRQSREPLEVLVADTGGTLVGFAEVSLRDYAEGCTSSPVGYLEGWYVSPEARLRGVGAALVAAAERWARERGCTEFASDTELENEASAAAHLALGFEPSGVVRCFRKAI